MILSAFCLPSAGLSAALVGGLGFLLRLSSAELLEIVYSKRAFISGEVGVVLCALEPSVRVFLENCFPFGIGYSYHVFTLSWP